jgi:Tetracyclin repressor-like, C-terminal domain
MALDAMLARMIRKKVLVARRRSIRAAFDRGVPRGESDRGFDIEVLIDMLTAPFHFRALFGQIPSTPATVNTVVDYLLSIVRPSTRGRLAPRA